MGYDSKRRGKFFVHRGLLLALQAYAWACQGNVVGYEDTGIRGQVLRGPVNPGPQAEGDPSEAPFSASFHVLNRRDIRVGRFRSDENGLFAIKLPSGDYTIVPDESAPLLSPQQQRKRVSVPPGSFATVVLRFDTGLR